MMKEQLDDRQKHTTMIHMIHTYIYMCVHVPVHVPVPVPVPVSVPVYVLSGTHVEKKREKEKEVYVCV